MKHLLTKSLIVTIVCCAFVACTKKQDSPNGVVLPDITGAWKGDGWLNTTKFDMNFEIRKDKDSIIYTSGPYIYRGTWKIDEFTMVSTFPTMYAGNTDTIIIWSPVGSKRLYGNWYYKKNNSVWGTYDLKRPI